MNDNIEEHQMPIHMDDLTANIHGTGDFIIELKYCKWKIHKEKFMAASTFFAKAMEAGRWKEGEEQYIKLHDDNPITFARCIQFIYDGEYSDCESFSEYYGCKTECTKVLSTQSLITGMPVVSKDYLKEVDYSENDVVDPYERIHKFMKDHKNRRCENYMPHTEREADMEAYSWKEGMEVHILMYQIADKYGIEGLRQKALSLLEKEVERDRSYEWFATITCRCYPDCDLIEFEVKKVIAMGIQQYYEEIKSGQDEASVEIRGWLNSDNELCVMVMDSFAEIVGLFRKDVQERMEEETRVLAMRPSLHENAERLAALISQTEMMLQRR